MKRGGEWQVVENSERKRVAEALREALEREQAARTQAEALARLRERIIGISGTTCASRWRR